ncbi:hypothetical protein LUZ60_005392 [Juncus effusus]|nr:hypothetical protein LUZ60_005392 [Juncus effusus]
MRSDGGGGFASSMIRWTSHKLSSLITSSILPSSSRDSESDVVKTRDAAIEDLKKLERTMKQIQAIATDAEQRGVKDQAEKLRIKELKEVAYDVDDVVDEYEFEVLSAKIRAGIHLGGDDYKRKREDEVNQVTPSQLIVPVPTELAIRIKDIRERFDEIINEWEVLRWSENDNRGRYDVDMVAMTESTSLVHEPSIHGRDKDKENIIKILISDDSTYDGAGSLSVLPLVGMGGIGKTALAQLVYNDPRVCEYFQLRAWVCVSEDFSVKILTRNIIDSFTNKPCNFVQLNELQRSLVNEVMGKRFLIVLDDVWNDKPNLWHSLKAPLTGTSFGKIIVTTRNENVARIMKTMPSYVLNYLSFEHCWSLFTQLAFECQDPNSNPGLVEIGREIVRKCGGLPLAVKALGSLLRFELDVENWQEILDSWELEMRNSDVLPALKVSYDRLPAYLKQCFHVLGLFPKDYFILKENLVRLWLSLGLVQPEGRKSPEDIGEGYANELLQRSMLQLKDGLEGCFIMHDLVNDLAQSVSRDDVSRIEHDMLHKLPAEVRYISVVHDNNIINLQYLNNVRAPRLLQVVNTRNYRDERPIANVKLREQVFEALRPHANIEELEMYNYVGSSYPRWFVDATFSKLVKFTLSGSYMSSKSLPTLGQLPSLRDLLIYSMSSIKNVGREFCSHDSKSVGFKSLKTLGFEYMPNWVNWSGVKNGEFRSLLTLRFVSCHNLRFLPKPLCSLLSTLEVHDCGILTMPRILPFLNCLIMSGDISGVFFDELYLPLLKTLKVRCLSSILLVLNSQNLPSVEVIEISSCQILVNTVGLSTLNSLKELQLCNCPYLQVASNELPPHGVQRLSIVGCPQLHDWEHLQIRRN